MNKITLKDFPQSVKRAGKTFTIFSFWTYRNTDGSDCFYRVRYNGQDLNDKGKIGKTFSVYHQVDGKLISKLPAMDKLPPFKADIISGRMSADYLIVEGEKAATSITAQGLDDEEVLVTTLEGVPKKSDLSLLKVTKKRRGYYLPDKDEAGYRKAIDVMEAIKDIKILRPWEEWGPGESIDDYDLDALDFISWMEISEGMTLQELYSLTGREEPIRKEIEKERKRQLSGDNKQPFIFMGFDDKAYYFIPQNQNIPIKISRGENSLKNNLGEIAPEEWWLSRFLKETEFGPRVDMFEAIGWLRKESYRRGIYDSSRLLGVGPHVDDNGKILINTGRAIQIYGNGEIDYNDYSGDMAFIRSKHRFEIKGEPWKKKDRKCFIEQVNTFGFEAAIQKICLIGWCVTAPFASLFEFRPHIWITAKKGTGKSWMMDHILEPAIGPFLTKVEGRTTEAAVRQTVGRDSRPVLIDEFEANSKGETAILNGVMALARSAYGGGEIIKGTPNHESISFHTKMTFCFSSVRYIFNNSADESRVVVISMKESPGKMTAAPEMAGLRKMMFDRLYDLLENIKLVKKEILKLGFDERTGDTYSPLIAGYWMIISDEKFMQEECFNLRMIELLKTIGPEGGKHEDEDSALDLILSYSVRIDPSLSKTVAELLTEYEGGTLDKKLKYDEQLRRSGIRRFTKLVGGVEREVLAISSNHQEIRNNIMKDTAYFEYKEVLSRHKAFIPGDKSKFPLAHMAGKSDRVIMLDWQMIEDEHLRIPEGDEGIPF